LEGLKNGLEKGCPRHELTCERAAYHGHLEWLKYAHENGCSRNEETCDGAAGNGHLDCLQYAHENGCSWNFPFQWKKAKWLLKIQH